jgi:hypothetical protein
MNAEQLELFPKEEFTLQPSNSVQSEENKFYDAEWCFQFFENEPIVFAWSNGQEPAGDLVLSISPDHNSNIVFSNMGMTFRLFARPISDETKILREKNKNQ